MYLEGGDLLRITESELLRFGLSIGLDIDDRTVVELQQSGARSETRVRAANMISSRPLSRKELSKKLKEKGAAEADAESACDWLEEIGALNDAEYAAMLVRHYGGMGYGEAKIRDELYRRGVPRELWEGALSQSPEAQEAIARVIAQKTKGRVLDEKLVEEITPIVGETIHHNCRPANRLYKTEAARGLTADTFAKLMSRL